MGLPTWFVLIRLLAILCWLTLTRTRQLSLELLPCLGRSILLVVLVATASRLFILTHSWILLNQLSIGVFTVSRFHTPIFIGMWPLTFRSRRFVFSFFFAKRIFLISHYESRFPSLHRMAPPTSSGPPAPLSPMPELTMCVVSFIFPTCFAFAPLSEAQYHSGSMDALR